eukprot:2971413-Amphidinium_carterae.2
MNWASDAGLIHDVPFNSVEGTCDTQTMSDAAKELMTTWQGLARKRAALICADVLISKQSASERIESWISRPWK